MVHYYRNSTVLILRPIYDGRLRTSRMCVISNSLLFTFRVSRRPREMYCGHARLCVCLSAAACLHHCTDPDVTWGSGRGCPLVVHYRADLQSVHWLRCYGNVTRTLVTSANAKC